MKDDTVMKEYLEKIEELLPCPFCGSKANLGDSREGFWVNCLKGGCIVLPSDDDIFFTSKETAIEHWNTRHQEKP